MLLCILPFTVFDILLDQLLEIPKVGGLHHRYELREAA